MIPTDGADAIFANAPMFDYLKKAFWVGPTVPGLGRLPVNALATAGFGILGFGHPAFWLLGFGLEVGYLAFVASDQRFQRWVDRERKRQQQGEREPEAGRQELIQKLGPEARRRLAVLEEKCLRALQVSHEAHADDFELESNRDALDRLRWIYLKLLVARHYLESSQAQTSEADLQRRIADLQRDMGREEATASLRASQSATLKILNQRLQNVVRREKTSKEVDSDLSRIEAQVDLALESATLRGGGAADTANLELASEILDDGLYFGDSETTVAALDQAYASTGAHPPPVREPQRPDR